jgi:hypothetical protein
MALTGFSTKYRTLKIAFLIRKDSIDDFLSAVKINTLLWGGIHNPIIPVGSDPKEAIELIKSIPVDILHPVVLDDNINAVLKEFPFLKAPRHFTYEIFTEDWDTKKKKLVYLDSLNIIEKHYHKYFKGQSSKGGSNCILVKWANDDQFKNIFSLTFGNYENNFNLLDDFDIAFRKGLRAQEINIKKNDVVPDLAAGKISPLVLTSMDLKNYRGDHYRQNGAFIGDPDDFHDLVIFWNLRATGLIIEFIPINNEDRFVPFIQKHLDILEARISKKPSFHSNLVFYHRSKKQEDIDRIYSKFKTKSIGLFKSEIPSDILSDLLRGLPTDYLNWETTKGFVEKTYDKFSVNITLPEKKFITDESERDISNQSLAISVDSFSHFGFSGYTLKLPFLRSLNEFYSREITFDPWTIRSEEGSFAVIIDINDKDINLYPISHQALINRIFDLAGIKAKRSQPGLLTQEIINSMRESEALEACRVFKIKGVRALLKSLEADEKINYTDALKTIGENNFNRHKKLFIESRDEDELKPQDVFNFLVKKRIFKPVLRVFEKVIRRRKEFKCSKCGLASMIRFSAFERSWVCEYCDHNQYLPDFIPAEFKKNKYWTYKKRGLFSKGNNQEGAIPVILSLLVLKHIFTHNDFLYSTSLICDGCEKKPEVDFVVLQYGHRDNRIEIAFGECKSNTGEINKDDIEKMKSVKEKFEPLGIHCHLIFAKTNDSFSATEIALFKELESEHCPFILLLNQELETNHHLYWEDTDFEKLPYKYALTLNELGINSRFRYLNQPVVTTPGN